MMKYVYCLIVVAVSLAGCSRYGYVSLNYPQPPQIYLPDDVHYIAAVNRSLVEEEDEDDKIVESIATGEIAGSDRRASDDCIKGVYDAARGMEGIRLIIPQQVELYGTGTRELPELLDWELVTWICEKEGADALLVLETFDSNSDLLLSAAKEQVVAIISTGSPQPVVPGKVTVNVACYWRLYHPGTRTIIDQFQHNSYMTFDLNQGLPPPHALPEAAYESGVDYIQRFLPGFYVVRRHLYRRTSGSAKQQFKAGYRMTEVANWEGAMEVWDGLTDHRSRKTSGRACLNIAVANEVLGNTDLALEWSNRSYEYYKDKLGRDYSKILLRRRNIEGY